ncbi:MAG TPA: SDR family oxidoreductase [Novosphingobium sp.]|nr:SDR family oxidoreductase [Novosphingobium sp.]
MDLSTARHAFITGGASGIGLGIADALAARGLAVTLADIDAEALAEVVAARGPAFRGVVLDTRDREGWISARDEAEAASGPVDVLVNNAGIAPDGKLWSEADPDSFDRIIAINLTGVFNGVWAFAGAMRARGRGHIVNTSSQAGLAASMPGVGAYSVAKFGVTALSENLRKELAGSGVGVSVLCPGLVQTNLGRNTAKISGVVRSENLEMPPSDVTPAAVGRMVVRGIEADAPYIITHKSAWRGQEDRFAAIRQACDMAEGT